MTQRTKPKINIVWDESVICIAPSFPQLERFLSFEEKKLEMDTTTWERKSVKIRRNVFTVLVDSPHGRVIQTYQGLKNKVVRFLQENDYEFMVHDQRMPFPEPRFELMTGFRFSQQRLVTEMLLARQSGLLGAPTRYGKTRMILNTLRAFPKLGTVVTAPGADLIGQLYDDVRAWMPNRDVVQLGGGSNKKYPSEEITVCSMDSLHKCDTGKVELVLIDEPHAVVTDSRMPMLHAFTKARKFGFGATLSGRYDQRDMLIEGLIGPVLSNITFKEAVDEGAICPIVVVMVKMPFSPFGARSRNGVYNSLLFKSDIMHKTIRDICTDIIPEDWQTITFIDNEAQADMMMEHMPEGTLAMAKKLTKTARQKVLDEMQANQIKRCVATNIYAQGVTFHDVMAIINAEGGGASIACVQKAGRLAEIRPGKKCGVVFDFLFECTNPQGRGQYQMAVRDSWNRVSLYRDKGYEVHIAENMAEAKALVERTVINR